MKNSTYHTRGKKVHGYAVAEHPGYSAWSGLKARCDNPNEPSYSNYGGRGITYCDDWQHFENFAHDMGIRPTPEHTIERADNDGNYCKDNCIWATRHEQSLNRRTFTNNSTGYTGVKLVKKNGRYTATMNFKKVRYMVSGTFETAKQAHDARAKLLAMLKEGKDVSNLTERKARFDSSTGIRGISRHVDGGYMVRVTQNGIRKYVGYYKNLEDAKEAIENEQK